MENFQKIHAIFLSLSFRKGLTGIFLAKNQLKKLIIMIMTFDFIIVQKIFNFFYLYTCTSAKTRP